MLRGSRQPCSRLSSKRAQTLAELEKHITRVKSLMVDTLAEFGSAERLRWLPVITRNGFWTAIIDTRTGLPVGWLAFDPY